MHFFRRKNKDQQVGNVILVLCANLGPVWVKREGIRGGG